MVKSRQGSEYKQSEVRVNVPCTYNISSIKSDEKVFFNSAEST